MTRLTLTTSAALLGLSATGSAFAASTTTYTYDALGRLVQASTTGTVNDGVQMSTAYDPADNRTTYQMTGSTPGPAVVVPISGLTVIPLKED